MIEAAIRQAELAEAHQEQELPPFLPNCRPSDYDLGLTLVQTNVGDLAVLSFRTATGEFTIFADEGQVGRMSARLLEMKVAMQKKLEVVSQGLIVPK